MKRCGNLIWLSKRTEKLEKINFQENEKKFLTSQKRYGKLIWLSQDRDLDN